MFALILLMRMSLAGGTVFNIHGNDDRLIARVNHRTGKVFILHILTHGEYNKGGWNR